MSKPLSIQAFFKMFPDDDACLAHLFEVRFGDDFPCPKCGQFGTWHRLKKVPAYTCNCGHHLHPMQGTPFERSRTSLQKWFYAIYLFTTTRHGVPAKELQRQLSVTYKTAWRMGHEIRKYMGEVDGDPPLSGHVEIDETYLGGVAKGKGPGFKREYKIPVLGMVQRGGDIMVRRIHRTDRANVIPHVRKNIKPGTRISTDEAPVYKRLTVEGYEHEWVTHRKEEWARGDTHTNTIENFWSQLKRSISGTHVWVSRKHLPKYLAEFEYRYNMRNKQHLMFDRLLASF